MPRAYCAAYSACPLGTSFLQLRGKVGSIDEPTEALIVGHNECGVVIDIRRSLTCMKYPAVGTKVRTATEDTAEASALSQTGRACEHSSDGSFYITIICNKRYRVCRYIISPGSGTVHELVIMGRKSRSAGSLLAEHIR